MKKKSLIIAFLAISFSAFAQIKDEVKQNDLKGPEYKNYKFWMYKTTPIKMYSSSNFKQLQGPQYKNYQPWKDTNKVDLVLVKTVGDEKQNLKGPEFKNFNHWRNKTK